MATVAPEYLKYRSAFRKTVVLLSLSLSLLPTKAETVLCMDVEAIAGFVDNLGDTGSEVLEDVLDPLKDSDVENGSQAFDEDPLEDKEDTDARFNKRSEVVAGAEDVLKGLLIDTLKFS